MSPARRGWRARARKLARAGLVASLVPFAAFGVYVAATPLPEALSAGAPSEADRDSVRVTDRTGVVLAELRDEQGMKQRRLPLADLGAPIQQAVIAAEDARFFDHFGVDPLAVGRALVASIARGRIVSGASTLTQQLARTLLGAPRTTAGKLKVMALAVKLEATFSKRRILEEYLNRIEFGPNVRGAEAAAWTFYGKRARDLSYGEAASLAAMVRGPTIYDPRRHPERLRARRDVVLDRMVQHEMIEPEQASLAKSEIIGAPSRYATARAPHFVAAVDRGRFDPCGPPWKRPVGAAVVRTTLIADLQRQIELAARATLRELEDRHATAASVVVVDNARGEILAYLGSPDASDVARLGGNDGVLARRQPGSTLKPFVYELGMDDGALTAATMMPDVELSFTAPDGDTFTPHNYDRLFHGPVLARQALGNSLNVPAVWLTDRLGAAHVLGRLREDGLCSLDDTPSRYGVGVALGDGEVTLLELTMAYAALARGGAPLSPRAVLDVETSEGEHIDFEPASPPAQARPSAPYVLDILTDPRARMASFGESTVLDLPFEVAAKTGTSKGYRDNWVVGSTPSITVGVWVGNFDGSPMHDVSGIAGAGPLFRASMLAAAPFAAPATFAKPADAVEVEICPLSGKRAGPDCPHRVTEIVPAKARIDRCDMHEKLFVERATGEVLGQGCDPRDAEERVFERFPPLLVPWARSVGRGIPEDKQSRLCPLRGEGRSVEILFPRDGARFYLTQGTSSIELRATFGEARGAFVLDGRTLAADARGRAVVALSPGEHELTATAAGATSAVVRFTVE